MILFTSFWICVVLNVFLKLGKKRSVVYDGSIDEKSIFPFWLKFSNLEFMAYWLFGWQATFKITLDGIPSELVALSNMPIEEEKVNGHLKTVSYVETPIMSTYLVAVVVGLFDYVEDHTSDGKLLYNILSFHVYFSTTVQPFS